MGSSMKMFLVASLLAISGAAVFHQPATGTARPSTTATDFWRFWKRDSTSTPLENSTYAIGVRERYAERWATVEDRTNGTEPMGVQQDHSTDFTSTTFPTGRVSASRRSDVNEFSEAGSKTNEAEGSVRTTDGTTEPDDAVSSSVDGLSQLGLTLATTSVRGIGKSQPEVTTSSVSDGESAATTVSCAQGRDVDTDARVGNWTSASASTRTSKRRVHRRDVATATPLPTSDAESTVSTHSVHQRSLTTTLATTIITEGYSTATSDGTVFKRDAEGTSYTAGPLQSTTGTSSPPSSTAIVKRHAEQLFTTPTTGSSHHSEIASSPTPSTV